jgi:ACT domain-containing protein
MDEEEITKIILECEKRDTEFKGKGSLTVSDLISMVKTTFSSCKKIRMVSNGIRISKKDDVDFASNYPTICDYINASGSAEIVRVFLLLAKFSGHTSTWIDFTYNLEDLRKAIPYF